MTQAPPTSIQLPGHETRKEVQITPDNMEARLVVQSQAPVGLTFDEVMEMLNERKVVFGIDHSQIKRELENYQKNPDHRHFECILARGQPPRPGKDGKVEILIPPPPPVSIDEHGRADYRNVMRYRMVDKGQTLAKLFPPEAGVAGMDVFGHEVKPPEPKRADIDDGPNVQIIPGTNEIVARVRGIFVQEKKRIDVNPVLQLPGNVGLDSGNVHYDGHVRIGNTIERAAEAYCSGDMEVGGAIESGQVRVGGGLFVRKGINTRHEGNIHVGGDLQSVYVDNSIITVEGSIKVYKSIISSQVLCYGDIHVSATNSALSGGEVTVYGSIDADFIGSKTETPTRIHLGLHVKNMQYYKVHLKELEDTEREHEKLRDDVARIKNYITRMRGQIPTAKQAEFRAVYHRYKDIVELRERLQKQIADLRESRYNPGEVRVIARQAIYPGVEIHYRDLVQKFTVTQTRVVLRFLPGLTAPKMEAWKG